MVCTIANILFSLLYIFSTSSWQKPTALCFSYNLYYVGGDVNSCLIQSNLVGSQWTVNTSIQNRHLWIWRYPWISIQNLWIWILIWMGNFISTATLTDSHCGRYVAERRSARQRRSSNIPLWQPLYDHCCNGGCSIRFIRNFIRHCCSCSTLNPR